jgi:hypothetical protein
VRVARSGDVLGERLSIQRVDDADFLNPERAAFLPSSMVFDGTSYWIAVFGFETNTILGAALLQVVRLSAAGELEGPAAEVARSSLLGSGCGTGPAPASLAIVNGEAIVAYPLGAGCRGPSPFGGSQMIGVPLSAAPGGTTIGEPFFLSPPNPPLPARPVAHVREPSAASRGDVGFAAWGELSSEETVPFVAGVLLRSSGDPERIRLAATSGRLDATADATAVATDGGDFLTVWAPGLELDREAVIDVSATRYRPGEGLLDPDGGFLVAAVPGLRGLGAVAFGASRYLVTWTAPDGVRGAWIGPDASVSLPLAITSSSGDSALGTAWNGERFLVVFSRRVPGEATASLLAALVSPPS